MVKNSMYRIIVKGNIHMQIFFFLTRHLAHRFFFFFELLFLDERKENCLWGTSDRGEWVHRDQSASRFKA